MDICNDGFRYVLVIFSSKLLTCIFLFGGEFSPSELFVQSPNNMYVTFLALATMCKAIDLFHIVISLSLAARYLARFRVTSQAWGKL